MMDELLRACLRDAPVDLLPRGCTLGDLHAVGEDDPPPIVIVLSSSDAAAPIERDALIPHPEAVIVRIERNGRLLSTRAVEVPRRVRNVSLTAQSIVDVIRSAPNWRARFD